MPDEHELEMIEKIKNLSAQIDIASGKDVTVKSLMVDGEISQNLWLPELIQLHRNRLKLSQQELADKVGVSRNYISLIERGQTDNVSFGIMRDIFSVLGFTLVILSNDGNGAVEHSFAPDGLERWALHCLCPSDGIYPGCPVHGQRRR